MYDLDTLKKDLAHTKRVVSCMKAQSLNNKLDRVELYNAQSRVYKLEKLIEDLEKTV